jgi:hypothetical protein
VDQINGPVYVARLSFDGTKAAWITSTQPDAGVVVVRDLPAARDLARIPVALASRGQQRFGSSLEVRNDGTVFYDVNDKQWTWTPGGLPRRTDQVPPSETPNHPAGFEAVDAPVRLSPDHLWGAWATDPEGHVPQSFDGVPLAVTVQKPDDPASRFTLRLPAGADLAPVPFWDSPTVLYFQGMSPQMITCDIVERQCRPMSNP